MSIKRYSLSEADRKWYVKCTFETAKYPWPLARQGTELKRVRQRLQIRVDSLRIARQIVDRIRTCRGPDQAIWRHRRRGYCRCDERSLRIEDLARRFES